MHPSYDTVPHDAPDADLRLAGLLRRHLAGLPALEPVNVLAIGSDRTTGDCLGPLVGEWLSDIPGVRVFGTLDDPVHAANIADVVPRISGFTIAVDAALGSPVGSICVRSGSLAPGAAFGRGLPDVGDVSMSALVCEAGSLGFERLRSVRLGFVRRLASVISIAIGHVVDGRSASRLPSASAPHRDSLDAGLAAAAGLVLRHPSLPQPG